MAATALIKFTQGLVVGADGEALLGVANESVHVSNVDNTDVQSWQIDLAYVDLRSAILAQVEYAFGNSSTPSADFVPDTAGGYRVVLKVWDSVGRSGDPTSVDIRVFGVPEEYGTFVPPSQVWPLPLPDPRSGEATARPNEMNFGGQVDGWAGTGGDGLLNSSLQSLDRLMAPVPPAPPPVPDPNSGQVFDAVMTVGIKRPVATFYRSGAVWVVNAGNYKAKERPSVVRLDPDTSRPDLVVVSPSDSEEWYNAAVDSAGRIWVVGDALRGTQRFMRFIDLTPTPHTISDRLPCGNSPGMAMSSNEIMPVPAPLSYDGQYMWTVNDGSAYAVDVNGNNVGNVAPSTGTDFTYADEAARLAALPSFVFPMDSGKTALQEDDDTCWYLEYTGDFAWVSTPSLGLTGYKGSQPKWVTWDTETSNYLDGLPRMWVLSFASHTGTSLDRFLNGTLELTITWPLNVARQVVVGGSSIYASMLNFDGDQIYRLVPETAVQVGSGLPDTAGYVESIAYDSSVPGFFALVTYPGCSGTLWRLVTLEAPTLTVLGADLLPLPPTAGNEPLKVNAILTPDFPHGWVPTGFDGPDILYRANFNTLALTAVTGKCFGYIPGKPNDKAAVRDLYVSSTADEYAERDGTQGRPFRTIQEALDVINYNVDYNQTDWSIHLSGGNHANDYQLVLSPKYYVANLFVSIRGEGAGNTNVAASALTVELPATANSSFVFAEFNSYANLVLLEKPDSLSIDCRLELYNASLSRIDGSGLTLTNLQILATGKNLSTYTASNLVAYSTTYLDTILCTTALCDVFLDGVVVFAGIEVSGSVTMQTVDFTWGAVGVMASQIYMKDSGFCEVSTNFTGRLTTTGAPHELGMDNASFARLLRFNTRIGSTLSTVKSIDGGEFSYEYPPVHTTTNAADQTLFQQSIEYFPLNCMVGVRVVVEAYNPEAATDYGLFQRHALVDRGTLVKEGDVLYADGPTVGMASNHSLRYVSDPTFIELQCTPHAYTDDHNVYWKIHAYYSLSRAS